VLLEHQDLLVYLELKEQQVLVLYLEDRKDKY
jgi:hypothetical protein